MLSNRVNAERAPRARILHLHLRAMHFWVLQILPRSRGRRGTGVAHAFGRIPRCTLRAPLLYTERLITLPLSAWSYLYGLVSLSCGPRMGLYWLDIVLVHS